MTLGDYFKNSWDFWLIWGLSLSLILIYGVINPYAQVKEQQQQRQENTQNTIVGFSSFISTYFASPKTFLKLLPNIGLMLFLGLYSFLILYQDDFVHNDYSHFTFFSLRDKFFGVPIWPSEGRFFPLGHQEFNLIGLFSKTFLVYHLFPILQLLIIVLAILWILKKFQIQFKQIIIILLLLTPSFVQSFFNLVIPERNIIFWLTLFVFCIIKYENNKTFYSFAGAVIATQFILYYKEPSFLLMGGFALSRLLIKFLEKPFKPYLIKKSIDFINKNWLEISVMLLSALFFLLYVVTILPKIQSSYAEKRTGLSEFWVLKEYLTSDLILLIFLVGFGLRLICLLLKKAKFDLIWDALAVGAILYSLAYIKLKLYTNYYLAPVDFIAIVYLGIIADRFFKRYSIRFPVILLLTTLLIIAIFPTSAYLMVAKKAFADGRIQFTNFLQQELSLKDLPEPVNLVFPANTNYDLMELSSYLNYKKIPLFPHTKKNLTSSSQAVYQIKTKEKQPKNACVSYLSYFKCYYTETIQTNDLIVLLPNHKTGLFREKIDNLADLKDKSEILWQYNPQSSSIQWMLTFLNRFRRLPDQWFNIYVLRVR